MLPSPGRASNDSAGDAVTSGTPWWRGYQEQLAARFHQEEIYIRALEAEVP